jgi:hypothetical protein
MATTSSQGTFEKSLLDALNAQLLRDAEPLLQDAIKHVEFELRRNLAANVISLLETSYSCERNGNILAIRVGIPEKR